jgi:hypothetical protein
MFFFLAATDDGGATIGSAILLLIVLALSLLLYFLPSVIANRRGHPNRTPIFVVNLLLGWTFLGWVAALVWSLTAFDR